MSFKANAETATLFAENLRRAGRIADAEQLEQIIKIEKNAKIKMHFGEALQLAMMLHRYEKKEQAEVIYRALLRVDPDHARVNHFLGVLLHLDKRRKDALRYMQRSMKLLGDQAWAWNNFGNLLNDDPKKGAQAQDAYETALRLAPDYPEAHNNLGIVFERAGRLEDALQNYKRATELKPDYFEAFYNLGYLYVSLERHDEAILALSQSIVLQGDDSTRQSRVLMAHAYRAIGQPEKSLAIFREWAQAEPDNPVARHMLAAQSGEKPDRAADSFVVSTFDSFADSFDSKLSMLGYRAPQIVAEALAEAHPDGLSFGVLADAGCGTGLCGVLVRERCKRMIGFDLSAGMLEKAEARGYDELHKAELTAFLRERLGAFNSIISADTLCYFGELDQFASAAFGALKSRGVLVFTVEALEGEGDDGFRLEPHGRYSHRRGFIEKRLSEAGLTVESIRQDTLRKEDAKPVKGWIVTARKPG
ncbi:tetratricopeptide repeat protein [Terrarubrum flagellatum]|uniref:tetratricopeptide repeat protein n=1 Tax=Terrirubrum flagellatum TaxID=2895980 RepID=UPI003144FDDC